MQQTVSYQLKLIGNQFFIKHRVFPKTCQNWPWVHLLLSIFKREASSWRLTAIEWCHGKRLVLPDDPDRKHVKFVWRCSILTHMTAINHLLWCHWIVASGLYTSSREYLGPNHPVRRLGPQHSLSGTTPLKGKRREHRWGQLELDGRIGWRGGEMGIPQAKIILK